MNGSPASLWCHGPPSSGKTVLASIVVNHLRTTFSKDDNVGVAVVYCEWRNRSIMSAGNLLASIWSQLTLDKALASEVEDLYKRHIEFGTTPRSHEIISILEREVARFSSVFIVVDAMDELTEEKSLTSIFIGALNKLTTSNRTRVHILATSNIELSNLERSSKIHITARPEDIELFARDAIEQGVSSSNDLSQSIRNSPKLKKRLVEGIRVKSSGLFLLARLFLQSLRYKTSPQRLIDAVENLPSSIYQQYKERLERVEQQKFDHSELARRILGWLTHAHRPMKVEELRHALAVKQGDKAINTQNLDMEDLFVPCCQGLVSIEKETQIIRLVHHTAQQYLDDNRLNLFPEMQAQILGTCLTYLSFDHFRRGRCSFESFGEYGEVNKVANGKRIAKWRFLPNRLSDFPFLHYAASNWGWHAAGEVGSSHVNEIITFLQSPMLLESAAQVQDCDMWPISEGSTNRVRTHLPLWVSGSFGLDSIASILLANTEAINVNERYGLEQNILLEQAVEAGNLGLVRVLLHAGADIKLPRPELNTISRAERPILYTAIAHGHDAIVEALLLQRPFMQIEESVFYCAAFREREAIIRSILDHSNDDSERVDRAHQILFHAACLGKLSAIELALQLGASVSTKNTNGQTALFVAVEHGRYDAVEKLLSAGSITTERDASSKSLLQVAVGTHRIIQERLRCIEDYGCNYEGIPGLSIGPCSLSEPIIPDAWLLAKLDTWFEDCTAKELIKSIAFKRDVVYEDSEHTKVMKRILACQGNVNEKNSEGQSLLHLAVCSTLERARTFIQVSGNALIIDERDNNGRTPLHYAAARGKAAIMKLLLDHGARIDLVDNDDATTLHFSIMSPACTKLTLERGNLIHAQDKLCRTALHYTALLEEPNLKVRDMLLAGGVRPGTVDIYRQTAQYYYDTHSDGHFESHKGGQFLGHMMYQCSTELANRALYSAIDNCQYYHQRYSVRFHMQIQENAIASAKREKRWTIVSDSEDEDFGK